MYFVSFVINCKSIMQLDFLQDICLIFKNLNCNKLVCVIYSLYNQLIKCEIYAISRKLKNEVIWDKHH